MLTLIKSEGAVPIVGIYRGKRNKRAAATVYFTHNINEEDQNVAPAAGVLHLHKSSIKKELHLNEADFKEICRRRARKGRPAATRLLGRTREI